MAPSSVSYKSMDSKEEEYGSVRDVTVWTAIQWGNTAAAERVGTEVLKENKVK